MRIYKHLKALNNPFNLKNMLSHLSKEYVLQILSHLSKEHVLQDWVLQLHNLVTTTYVNIIFR